MTMSAAGSYTTYICNPFPCVLDSLLEQKVDQLTEMMAEVRERVQGGEGHGPA